MIKHSFANFKKLYGPQLVDVNQQVIQDGGRVMVQDYSKLIQSTWAPAEAWSEVNHNITMQ